MAPIYLAATILFLATASQRSFVDTAALPQPKDQERHQEASVQDASVQELEDLKENLDKTVKMLETHSFVYGDLNGRKEYHSDAAKEVIFQVDRNGKVVAKVGQHVDENLDANPSARIQTELDIPSENVHKTYVHTINKEEQKDDILAPASPASKPKPPEEKRKVNAHMETAEYPNGIDKAAGYPGIQYSPLDMAEYIFWTGDEKGVTLAVEEILQEGLMSREEAISFLQEIKYNLDYLQSHYSQLGANLQDQYKEPVVPTALMENKRKSTTLEKSPDIGQEKQPEKKSSPKGPENINKETVAHQVQKPLIGQDEDYDELLDRLRVADFLYTEYSLEEVIYQLAKVMFTQSLTKGNAEAQKALQKFTTFLEAEADAGRISRALEKKVLDVLIASLSDTLSEHPDLVSTVRQNLPSNAERQQLLRKILELNPEGRVVSNSYKEPGTRVNLLHDNVKHTPLGFAKTVLRLTRSIAT